MSAPEVSPAKAWEMLQRDPNALLIDVRTLPEWQFVGVPDLTPLGRETVKLSWNTWPGAVPNQHFIDELKQRARPDQTLLFLCRSGVRSLAAANAAIAAGFFKSVNVAQGFEGDRDGGKQRGKVGGWKHAGLPWTQE